MFITHTSTMLKSCAGLVTALVLLSACSPEAPTAAPAGPVKTAATSTPVHVEPLAPSAPAAKTLTGEQAQVHLLKQFDGDGDGKVSMREVLADAVKKQLSADVNQDRVLSSEEFHRGLGDSSLQDDYVSQAFARIDENKDSKLDEREIASHAWGGIVHLDANHDGFVTSAETLTARSR